MFVCVSMERDRFCVGILDVRPSLPSLCFYAVSPSYALFPHSHPSVPSASSQLYIRGGSSKHADSNDDDDDEEAADDDDDDDHDDFSKTVCR